MVELICTFISHTCLVFTVLNDDHKLLKVHTWRNRNRVITDFHSIHKRHCNWQLNEKWSTHLLQIPFQQFSIRPQQFMSVRYWDMSSNNYLSTVHLKPGMVLTNHSVLVLSLDTVCLQKLMKSTLCILQCPVAMQVSSEVCFFCLQQTEISGHVCTYHKNIFVKIKNSAIADKPCNALRGQSISPNMVPFHMLGMVSY